MEKKKYPCCLYNKQNETKICKNEEEYISLSKHGFDRWGIIFGEKTNEEKKKSDSSNQILDDTKTGKEAKDKLIAEFGYKKNDFKGLKKDDIFNILSEEIKNAEEEN